MLHECHDSHNLFAFTPVTVFLDLLPSPGTYSMYVWPPIFKCSLLLASHLFPYISPSYWIPHTISLPEYLMQFQFHLASSHFNSSYWHSSFFPNSTSFQLSKFLWGLDHFFNNQLQSSTQCLLPWPMYFWEFLSYSFLRFLSWAHNSFSFHFNTLNCRLKRVWFPSHLHWDYTVSSYTNPDFFSALRRNRLKTLPSFEVSIATEENI